MRQYTKVALSIDEQIVLLKERGLIIADEIKAKKFLSEVSYFRFVQYLRPMEGDKDTHQFKPNSRFEDAVALYEFDAKLRNIIFWAIQKIEIALRTKIIHEFSLKYGAFWFIDAKLVNDEHQFVENLSALDREIQRSKDDFIIEHQKKYDNSSFPPAWKTLELASLGTLSKLYGNFKDRKVKNRIAHQFNLPQYEVLESWTRSLTIVRNYCAHHSRLWNRRLANAPRVNASFRGNWVSTEELATKKVYTICCCIAYWLVDMGDAQEFTNSLKTLLSSYFQVDPFAMGFPSNWKEEPLWRSC